MASGKDDPTPKASAAAPPAGGGGLCAPGTLPAPIGGECLPPLPFAGGRQEAFEQRADTSWLDESTGQMGDLLE
jgi:hypothetical protein